MPGIREHFLDCILSMLQAEETRSAALASGSQMRVRMVSCAMVSTKRWVFQGKDRRARASRSTFMHGPRLWLQKLEVAGLAVTVASIYGNCDDAGETRDTMGKAMDAMREDNGVQVIEMRQ